MNIPPPRAGIGSPRLIGLLANPAAAPLPAAKSSLAAWLGRNLDLPAAIALSAALAPVAAKPPAGSDSVGAAGNDLRAEVARLRAAFAAAVDADCRLGECGTDGTNGARGTAAARSRLPQPRAGVAREAQEFQPYRRYYAARQREMEAAMVPLRGRLRAALTAQSPARAQLAALDAVLAAALAERERDALAGVPQVLEARFEELRGERRAGSPQSRAAAVAAATPAMAATADGASECTQERTTEGTQAGVPANTAAWLRPGGWLAVFHETLRSVLLAELDFRLLPLAGLAAVLADGSPRCAA